MLLTRHLSQALIVVALIGCAPLALAEQTPTKASAGDSPDQQTQSSAAIDQAINRGVQLVLRMQEGDEDAEWPYEGVYRVKGVIPVGYRVGGSAIAADALILALGYEDDAKRQSAVRRACVFITNSIDHPLMAHHFESRYDVRGWGYTYG